MIRIQEFARLAGVTVRTLHHYDRLGLLSPRQRTESKYRLYALEDMAQLERILVLRYVGLSLREIAELLPRNARQTTESLPATLARQTAVLRERRDGIDRILRAIDEVQQHPGGEAVPEWTLYQTLLKEIHMQQSQDFARKYYSPEAQQTVDDLKQQYTPELQAKITADWTSMFAKVEDALARNVDPKSEEGKALAADWMKLVEQFTGGNPEVLAGLNKMYADRENWPAAQQQQAPVKPELMAFIRQATAA